MARLRSGALRPAIQLFKSHQRPKKGQKGQKDSFVATFLSFFQFTSELFFNVLLPPIILVLKDCCSSISLETGCPVAGGVKLQRRKLRCRTELSRLLWVAVQVLYNLVNYEVVILWHQPLKRHLSETHSCNLVSTCPTQLSERELLTIAMIVWLVRLQYFRFFAAFPFNANISI